MGRVRHRRGRGSDSAGCAAAIVAALLIGAVLLALGIAYRLYVG